MILLGDSASLPAVAVAAAAAAVAGAVVHALQVLSCWAGPAE